MLEQGHIILWLGTIAVAFLIYRKFLSKKNTAVVPVEETKDFHEPFVYPMIAPCRQALKEMKPIPYRPFRWGDYHVTMGIKTIHLDTWIEVDNQLAHFHRIRTHRVKTRGPQLVQALPPNDIVKVHGRDAATELVEELSEYLSRRYPEVYTVERYPMGSGGWYDDGRIRMITILPVNAVYNLDYEDPMTIAGLLIQDDIALMLEGTDSVYYLRAGAIILPGFWRLEDKIGMSIDSIHLSGNVPQYQQKLQTSLNRFLQRLTPDKLIQRNNYHFAVFKDPASAGGPFDPLDPTEIGWAETMVGKEELFQAGTGLGTQEGGNAAPKSGGHGSSPLHDVKPSNVTLRQERQTLRRLPRTGAIVFTVRTYVEPVTDLVKEVGVPGRMASAIRSWPEDVAQYKSRDRFASHILPFLDQHHEKQISDGLLAPHEKPHSSYPF